jgi:hypothetical protein
MTRYYQPDGHLHGVIVACQREDGRWLLIRRALPEGTMENHRESCKPLYVKDFGESCGSGQLFMNQ